MEEVRERLPFCLDFMAVNYCVYMYLFASPESVVLKETVTLTQETGHSMIANCPIANCGLRGRGGPQFQLAIGNRELAIT